MVFGSWQVRVAIGLFAMMGAQQPCTAAAGPRLLLAGGHLPVCSSANAEACRPGKVPGPAALANRYRLDRAGIERIRASGWLAQRERVRERIVAALQRGHERAGDTDFAADELPNLLDGARDVRAWRDLASFEQDRVLDALERETARETVALDDSLSSSGAAIYREFVAMARNASGRERPRILLSTASGRDPFESIAFYRDVFEQAGGEVRWLPLDHALRAALDGGDGRCVELDVLRGERLGAHDRARMHPERAAELDAACRDPQRLDAAIEWADGVFMNGGDQSFTRAAWFAADGQASTQLQHLLRRLDSGKLVLGGTSAGTAVQSLRPATSAAAMIVSGPALPSSAALAIVQLPPFEDCARASACGGVAADALLYHPGGGLGSFGFGVLDTHFSNRGREYRLARLLLDSGVAVGVDETTALRVDRDADGAMRGTVVGVGGVTLLQHIAGERLLRTRYLAGSSMPLPPPAASGECTAGAAAPSTILADSDALMTWLDAVVSSNGQPLALIQGSRTLAAGRVCAIADATPPRSGISGPTRPRPA